MKTDQKYSPKYWVGHHKGNEDVMLHTASKTRADTVSIMEETYGEDWFLDEDFDIILIEILEVKR